MAATGRDVPLVQLTGGDRRRSGRGPRRPGRGHCHGSIPAAGRAGRARHCVCGLGVRVDTWGSVGARRPDGRGNLRRGAGASGESALAPRSCQGESAVPRRRRSVGGTGDGGRALRATGDRVVRHRVPLRARPRARLRAGRRARLRARLPGGRRARRSRARRCVSPRFLAPRVRPVNVLSGHSDDMVRTTARTPPTSRPAAPPPRHPATPESTRHARPRTYVFVALVSQRARSRHTCHARTGLPSHPGTAPDRPSPGVVHP